MYVNGICGMNNCRNVMRFVDLFYVDGQIRLLFGEYFVDVCIMCWVYKILILVLGDFNYVWYYVDFVYDICQMYMVMSGQMNKGVVDVIIFFFCI